MNACEKNKKPIGKAGYPAGYPVSGNLLISGRISESGFSKPGYPGIRNPGSKSVSGTTLVIITIFLGKKLPILDSRVQF